MNACKQEKFEEDLDTICAFYQDDFNKKLLQVQLQTLRTHFNMKEQPATQASIFDVKHHFLPDKPLYILKLNTSCS